MNKKYILGIIILLIGVLIFTIKNMYAPRYATDAEGTSSSTVNMQSYTRMDVSAHENAASCYSSINGNVYDLTDWINKHPGGPLKILMLCGKDGSALFNMQHGAGKREASILSTYKIGILVQ
jgi:cytochrome b involved in lipid metabolism